MSKKYQWYQQDLSLCLYSDAIYCIGGNCETCDYFYRFFQHNKYVQLPEQLTIEQYLEEYMNGKK